MEADVNTLPEPAAPVRRDTCPDCGEAIAQYRQHPVGGCCYACELHAIAASMARVYGPRTPSPESAASWERLWRAMGGGQTFPGVGR